MADVPPISALFLVRFDIKTGYTISWNRALPGIDLEGAVEYKSLPSGLHTVAKDLVYFLHGDCAGLSAFVSVPASEDERNAVMLAVGVLVPLSFGRLGRSWKHADRLTTIAQQLASDGQDLQPLEDYWSSNQATLDNDTPSTPVKTRTNKNSHGRIRSASDGQMLLPREPPLTRHHPALRLTQLLKTFGPLIFPIYRAALLRKRMLISCHAPVQQTCDFVYNISVLSNIPTSVDELIIASAPPQRLQPLFTVGVHDIPWLEADNRASKTSMPPQNTENASTTMGHGWVACTTDDILGQKINLYDVLISMPSKSHPAWPTVQMSSSKPVKATQRDLRRYRALNWSLSRVSETRSRTPANIHPGLNRRQSSNNFLTTNEATISMENADAIVEPQSWSALAYSGFMWWASAGAPEISMNDEFASDSALLDDLMSGLSAHGEPSDVDPLTRDNEVTLEAGIIAYFHHMTTAIFQTIANVIEDSSESDHESSDQAVGGRDEPFETDTQRLRRETTDEDVIYINSEDMVSMGLDDWSVTDHEFVIEICKVYFGRTAIIEGRNLDVCGVRIC